MNKINYNYLIKISNSDKIFYLSGESSEDIRYNGIVYKKNKIKIDKITLDDFGVNSIKITGYFDKQMSYEFIDESTIFSIYLLQNKLLVKNFGEYRCTEVKKDNLRFYLMLESNLKNLEQIICEKFNNKCRAELGDFRCKKDIESMSKKYSVREYSANIIHLNNCDEEYGYYTYGLATINYQEKIFNTKITSHQDNVLKLDKIIPLYIEKIEEITLYPGCDKKISTCCNKFNNVINFRGEPFVQDNIERIKNFMDTIKI